MTPSALRPSLPSLALAGLLVLAAGCSGDSGPTGPTGSSTVTLDLVGLQPLAGGVNYQAWALAARSGNNYYGYPLVLFNLDEEGQLVDPASGDLLGDSFHANLDPEEVLGVGISLENSSVAVNASSFTFILGGLTLDGTVTLTAADETLGLGVDLSGAEGNYLLGTLTDQDPENDLGGLWFVEPADGGYTAGLSLPEAPVGWDYEGWVEVEGVPLSTGKFFLPTGADGSNVYSSGLIGPDWPGEDFLADPPAGITFPVDLSGAKVFVTLEPWQEWDAFPEDPFYLRILEADVPGDVLPLTSYPLAAVIGQFLPSGTATVQ